MCWYFVRIFAAGIRTHDLIYFYLPVSGKRRLQIVEVQQKDLIQVDIFRAFEEILMFVCRSFLCLLGYPKIRPGTDPTNPCALVNTKTSCCLTNTELYTIFCYLMATEPLCTSCQHYLNPQLKNLGTDQFSIVWKVSWDSNTCKSLTNNDNYKIGAIKRNRANLVEPSLHNSI